MKPRFFADSTLLFALLFAGSHSLFCQPDSTKESTLLTQLRSLPHVLSVKKIRADSTLFEEAFELQFSQLLDHARTGGPTFAQKIFVSHAGTDRPVVLSTEGYAATRNHTAEPTRILKCNQITVEHRYFGTSRPDSLIWDYLTVRQSADDLHEVVAVLKQIYAGPWVSTGVSKGGQTTLLYRYFYPGDVSVSIPYVAPVNIAQEDPRPMEFLRHVGPDSCREKMRLFQIAMLKEEDRMLPILEKYAQARGYSFSLGLRKMYEFAILEYSFSFWQYGKPDLCEAIPAPGSSPDSMFAHLSRAVSFSLFDDKGVKYYQPFMYQAYTEMGYYSYDVSDFRTLLQAVEDPSPRIFAPENVPLRYQCSTYQEINRWLQNEGSNIIYIYGEYDPWSACAVQLSGRTNALKMVKKAGSHSTRIRDLSPEQQGTVYRTLEEWLGKPITR
jgi:hypothetical protein